MTWIVGLTNDPAKRRSELGNPSDWQQTEFATEDAAKAWKDKYIGQQGYVEDDNGSGWRFGYWYSTNLIPCPDCGKMISPNAGSCLECGRPIRGQTLEDNTGKTKCPKCGSTNIQVGQEGSTQGFGAGKGCLGTILFGPIGLLCGLCGMGKGKTKAVRMCVDCGKKF